MPWWPSPFDGVTLDVGAPAESNGSCNPNPVHNPETGQWSWCNPIKNECSLDGVWLSVKNDSPFIVDLSVTVFGAAYPDHVQRDTSILPGDSHVADLDKIGFHGDKRTRECGENFPLYIDVFGGGGWLDPVSLTLSCDPCGVLEYQDDRPGNWQRRGPPFKKKRPTHVQIDRDQRRRTDSQLIRKHRRNVR